MSTHVNNPRRINAAERIIAVFTIVLAVLACIHAFIFWQQLRTARLDERPWVTLTITEEQTNKLPSEDYILNFSGNLINSGKSPAVKVSATIVAEILKSDEAPDFDFNRPALGDTAGILFPMEPYGIQIPVMSRLQIGPRTLSQSDLQELKDGKDYIVLYAEIHYEDTLGTKHQVHYCYWRAYGGSVVHAKSCTEYNSVDSN